MLTRLLSLSALSCLLSIPSFLSGQTVNSDTRIQQLQQFDRFFDIRTPQAGTSESAALPAEESDETDIGEQRILLSKPTPQYWRLYFDSALIHSTNAFLSPSNTLSDTYYAGTLGAQYQRNLSDSVGFTAAVRQQFFRYFEYSALDFNHTSLSTRIHWIAPESLANLMFWGQWQWNSLTAARSNPTGVSFGDEFLRYHVFSGGVQKAFFLDDFQFLFVGASAQFGLTENSKGSRLRDPQKDTYSLFVGYNYQYSRSLVAQVGYYLNRNLYDHLRTAGGKHRHDWNHTVSASAIWKFNPWLSAGANLSYVWNRSNERFYRYENGNLGLNLEMNYRF